MIITGSNFSYIDGVNFGDEECTNMTVVSVSKITCTIPAHDAGTVKVVVYGRIGRRASANYTYEVTYPTISTFIPSIGNLTGGNNLSIVGTGFLAGATVTIGGTTCVSPVVINSKNISCILPTKTAGSYAVVVTNIDNLSATATGTYTYAITPTVSSVSPTSGILAGGATLTITGTNFVAGAIVTIGSTDCPSVTVVSSTSITCVLPAKIAGTYNVLVTNPNNRTGSKSGAFYYKPMPTISFAAPAVGVPAGGDTITIYGSGFITLATATIDGVACTSPTVTSGTTMTCVVPANVPGVYDIVVTNADTQSGTKLNGYTYSPPPVITAVSPEEGPLAGGNTLTITGTGFVSSASILVGVTPCASSSVVNSTTAVCVLPAQLAGTYGITFTNPDTQSVVYPAAYTYQEAPTVTNVALSAGALAGGTNVTVTGTGFLANATVDFGGSDCAVFGAINPTTITCTTTAHAAGVVDVVVTNEDTQTGTMSSGYTYQAAPSVVSVSPNSGLQAGGESVTITGTGFVGSSADFDVSACVGVTVVNDTTITCTTPPHAGGVVAVTVVNSDGQSGSAAGAFTYTSIPILTFDPNTPYDFGQLNTDFTNTFTIRNTGEGPATAILTVSVTDIVAYTITADTCGGAVLAVNDTCTFDLTFNGLALSATPGIYPATLDVSTAASGGGPATNTVTGESIP